MIRIFPVAAPTTVSNDFGVARAAGGRGHEGNDLFANEGSPLVAVDDGELRSGFDPLGGNILNLRSSHDGVRYYYAHLSWFADAAGNALTAPPPPRIVRVGDLIGFLGRIGNAATTLAHVHFEEHPCGGRCATDPFPNLFRAPRVAPNQRFTSTRPSDDLLRTLAIVALAGTSAWALLNQQQAAQLVRRILPT